MDGCANRVVVAQLDRSQGTLGLMAIPSSGRRGAGTVPGRIALRAGARRDPLLPYVGDDPGRRGEVGVFVQDGQVMVQCGRHD
jgi:hypothetical protein